MRYTKSFENPTTGIRRGGRGLPLYKNQRPFHTSGKKSGWGKERPAKLTVISTGKNRSRINKNKYQLNSEKREKEKNMADPHAAPLQEGKLRS